MSSCHTGSVIDLFFFWNHLANCLLRIKMFLKGSFSFW